MEPELEGQLEAGLVHFASVPPPDPACRLCNSDGFSCKLHELGSSAQSGCQHCHLRYIAVLRVLGKTAENVPGMGLWRDDQFSQAYINFINFVGPGPLDYNEGMVLYTIDGEPRSSWPLVSVARDLALRRPSYQAIVLKWLATCHKEHSGCGPKGPVPLPTRLLDVEASDSGPDRIRLRETCGGESKGSYAALSHCWGGDIKPKTTLQNLQTHKSGILFGYLPRNFQDAVTVTRAIGLRYLWIDALCILQGDKGDWELESSNMANIYQNAHLVISADMSPDSHNGFLDHDPSRNDCGPASAGVPIAMVDGEGARIYAREHRSHGDVCREQPLAKRAWALQERLLAYRMVHFTDGDIVWECKAGQACECMELDYDYIGEREERWDIDISAAPSLTSNSSTNTYESWYKVVNMIAERDITKPLDLLPALSGLAKRYQTILGAGQYLAGLWRDDLWNGLLWMARSRSDDIGERATLYRAPSWSWASVTHKYGPYNPLVRVFGEPWARILDAECVPSGKDPLGTVKSGYLKLAAPFLEMDMIETMPPYHMTLGYRGQPERTFPTVQVNFDYKQAPTEFDTALYCLFIGKFTSSLEPKFFVMTLRRGPADTDTFKRVGYFTLNCDDVCGLLEVAVERVVTII